MSQINLNEIDRIKASSLILNVILLILLCMAGMVMRIPCPEQFINQVVQIDTIRPVDVPVQIAEGKPVVRKYVKVKVKPGGNSVVTPSVTHYNHIDTVINQPSQPIVATTINASVYSDTLYQADNYRAIINDTVNGEIIGRSVWFVNLKPEIKTTITNTVLKKEKVKLYFGMLAACDNNAKWGVGPSAIVTIPGAIAISYSYNIMLGVHNAIIAAPIQFGRRKN
jgi:hypothetical protein